MRNSMRIGTRPRTPRPRAPRLGRPGAGHEVDHPDRAVLGLELGLQDQGVAAVAAPDAPDPTGRGDPPVAIAPVAEQRREAGPGVEAGQAQPVDRAVPAHQGRGLGVGNDRIVLDPR